MEIELKLSVSTTDVQRAMRQQRLERFVTAGPSSAQLTTRYFDTDRFGLRQHGLSLRVRTDGSGAVQTLKSAGNGGIGVSERGEWEMPVTGSVPELELLCQLEGLPSKFSRVLRNLGRRAKLRERFRVDVTRQTWQLRVGKAHIEMALDEGWINCGETRVPVSELELELKSGDKSALYEMAKELAGQIAVRPGEMSKGARGYALCRGEAPGPTRAGRAGLSPDLTVDDGIHVILGSCLQHMLPNVQGILTSDDPEYLHQMRVGLRRFRSATKLFSPWATLPASIQEDLEWLGSLLGSARDHDVFVHSTLPAVQKALDPEDDLRPLRARADAIASEKRAALRAALHSPRFGQWMLSLIEWVERRIWRDTLDAAARSALDKPLTEFARMTVTRGHAKIEKRGRKLQPQDSARLHRLRVTCKQNRYVAEFFRDIERSRKAKQYVKKLTALQDTLGVRNDVTVGRRIVRVLSREVPELASAASLVLGNLACLGNAPLRGVRHDWKSFITHSPSKLFH